MDATFNKYRNAKVYKITTPSSNRFYIGSTCQPLWKRLSEHSSRFVQWNIDSGMPYCSSFKIISYLDYKIELLEAYPCNSKNEMITREAYYLKLLQRQCVNYKIFLNDPIGAKNEYNLKKQKQMDAILLFNEMVQL
jgi:hypothetical protein|tara:strand:- start:158 stop:565 length:408 start_codon:yes stop_codon:yes gene_type:complete